MFAGCVKTPSVKPKGFFIACCFRRQRNASDLFPLCPVAPNRRKVGRAAFPEKARKFRCNQVLAYKYHMN